MNKPQLALIALVFMIVGLAATPSQAIMPFSPCVELFVSGSEEKLKFHDIREVIGYLKQSDLPYEAKRQIWLDATAEINRREWFISIEVPVEYKEHKGTAFMGGEAGDNTKTLLVILESGKVHITPNSAMILNFVYRYKHKNSELVLISEPKPKEYVSRMIIEKIGLL